MSDSNWDEQSRTAWERYGTEGYPVQFDEDTLSGKLQKKELLWILSQIPQKRFKILDAGCGPGRYSLELTKRKNEVVGLDFAQPMLKQIRNKTKECAVLQGDIQYLPFTDERFDIVIMVNVLQHLKTPQMRFLAVKEAFRVSKEYVFVDVKNKLNPILSRRYKNVKDEFIRTAYSHSEIKQAIKKCNGRIVGSKGIGFPIKGIAPFIVIKASKSPRGDS
ncbi:MAG: class I SAM-dependent methyltransferase [Methanomassiliicoccales archaeon]|nr:MAG: class I SAM-dependent methyltransferase [Methanomassiliicoccales archaeon]